MAISLFGSKAIDAFLLPVVPTYWRQWEKALETTTSAEHRTELLMCQQAVLVSVVFVPYLVVALWVLIVQSDS